MSCCISNIFNKTFFDARPRREEIGKGLVFVFITSRLFLSYAKNASRRSNFACKIIKAKNFGIEFGQNLSFQVRPKHLIQALKIW